MRSALLLLLALQGASLLSQSFPRLYPPFSADGAELRLATAGGLNNPQLSAADFNGDGRQDLYVFDRMGNLHLAFLYDGSRYVFAPGYAADFPEAVNWVLLRDFNGDGVADMFTYSDAPGISGIRVFTGYMQQGRLAFRRLHFSNVYDLIDFPLPAGGRAPLYVSNIDYPAIDDVDCDGDFDIVTFNIAGGYAELYQNRSAELGHGRDSLIFRLSENCWGGFFESGIMPLVDLAPAPGKCASGLRGDQAPVIFRHAGSTLLTFDLDGDGDRELVLGDLSFSNLNLLSNGGKCGGAWMNSQDINFPDPSMPVQLDFFPASFYLDLTGDGRPDLAASPNALQDGENTDVIWLYQNTGAGGKASFSFHGKSFLSGEMLDLGSGAYPAFFDEDGDGKVDLLIGNGYRYSRPGERNARLFLFRNTGTALQPKFELTNDDYLEMSQFNSVGYSFVPTLGDLDGDGDEDLLVGEEQGMLYFAENVAGPGRPAAFGPWQYPYAGIDIGQGSAPAVADLNLDGRADLLVGERSGNINYFENIGTAGRPAFRADPDVPFLGKVDTRIPGLFTGSSAPVVVEQAGRLLLLTGSESGQIEAYHNLEGRLRDSFFLLNMHWGGVREGFRTRPALADIDSDGFYEVAVGNQRGGVAFFRTDLVAPGTVAVDPVAIEDSFRISPNPAGALVRLEWTGPGTDRPRLLHVFDAAGRRWYSETWSGGMLELDVRNWPPGGYIVRVASGRGVGVKPLFVAR